MDHHTYHPLVKARPWNRYLEGQVVSRWRSLRDWAMMQEIYLSRAVGLMWELSGSLRSQNPNYGMAAKGTLRRRSEPAGKQQYTQKCKVCERIQDLGGASTLAQPSLTREKNHISPPSSFIGLL